MMFIYVPLLLRSDATDAVLRLVRPLVMSFRGNLETGSGPALAAGIHAP